MAKSVFIDMIGKVKEGAVELADKAQSGTKEMADKVKETAGSIVKATREKVTVKNEKIETRSKIDKTILCKRPDEKIVLDDILIATMDQYNDAYTIMNDNGSVLYTERTRAVDMIVHIEELINSIANRPKEFDTEIVEIQMHRKSFIGTSEFAKAELEAAKKSALGAGAGVAAGAAIVSVAPTVAMWVATTFGTASTGTAISTLSGAAATHAALAWLGGGALTAGGGGMAAGHALLALAGPIGWGVAGVTLLSSVVLFKLNKMKLNKKKKEEIEKVKMNIESVQKAAAQIQELLDEVVSLRENLNNQYHECLINHGKDFMSIPKDQQLLLGVLVNNTKAMAASLGKNIH